MAHAEKPAAGEFPVSAVAQNNGYHPLAGVKVIDLTHVAAGPFCTSLLGQLGADVIKIERPGIGELNRAVKPAIGSGPVSWYFATVNVQKQYIQVDLRTAEGQAILHELVKSADVLVQNFAPGVAGRLGADEQTLRALNERLIYCSIVGFRSGSRYQHLSSFDHIHEAMAGVMSMTAYADEAPPLTGLPAADMSAGLYAVLGTVLALQAREKTGRGDTIEVPLQDCLLSLLPLRMGFTFATGKAYPPSGRYHQQFAPFGVFETQDSRIVLSVGSVELWKRFVQVIPELDREIFQTLDQRLKAKDDLYRRLNAILRTRSTADWLQAFGEAGVPAGAVMDTAEVANDPYTEDLIRELDVEGGKFRWVPYPVRHEMIDIVFDNPTGRPGRDTAAVLTELGFSQRELDALRERGIVDGC